MTEQKLALVTGASRGIGRAIAHTLAADGWCVVGTATTDAGAERITEGFKAGGYTGQGVVCDVSDRASIDACLEAVGAAFPGQHVAGLVNNAGITADDVMMRMKPEAWERVLSTNLSGCFHLSQRVLRPMMKARWGRIVQIGSVVGSMGNAGQANYAAAKAGLIGFSKALALEVASRGITVNVVAPGFIATDMTAALNDDQQAAIAKTIPMQRMGEPSDIASAVRFLTSNDAAYITGSTLHVNGGMWMA